MPDRPDPKPPKPPAVLPAVVFGKLHSIVGLKRIPDKTGEYMATIQVRVTYPKEFPVSTQMKTAFQALQAQYDKIKGGGLPTPTPTPTPTIGDVILASGKPAVIGLDQDDATQLDTTLTDVTGSNLASFLSGALPSN